jgi:hypothetical protein
MATLWPNGSELTTGRGWRTQTSPTRLKAHTVPVPVQEFIMYLPHDMLS